MESPNYAKWIPEAGGYVHNGTVVSTTPVYNEGSNRMEVDVDLSRLSVGNTQANTANSGQDVNTNLTNAGALASLNANTANTDYGVLNTPATHSSSAEEPVLNPIDQTLKDIAYHQANNNLMGEINGYKTLQQLTGQDYSAIINDRTQKRNQKILDTDNAYGQAITEAYMAGDAERIAQLQQEQAQWREQVGFGETQKVDYQMKQDDIQIRYEDAFLTGYNDIMNNLMNTFSDALGQFLNFQYNPNTDLRLQIAQGYAVGAVKEQMNHTGMYYSSMTQNAIARAVAELVPVYEQMAKQEMQDNIQMLMNAGNFLMNMEQTQFNMWKGQIEVQLELNQEKRRQYQDAMDRANAWGYVSNEDAVILGVAPGSPSPQALQEAREAQLKLAEEQRELYSKLVVADFTNTLAIQKMYAEQEVKAQYEAQQKYQDYLYNLSIANNKHANDIEMEGIKHANDIELENIKSYNDRLLQQVKNEKDATPKTTGQSILSTLGYSSDVISKYQSAIDGTYTKEQTKQFLNDSMQDLSLLTDEENEALNDIIKEELKAQCETDATLRHSLGYNAKDGTFSNSVNLNKKIEEYKTEAVKANNAKLLNAYITEGIEAQINEAIGTNFSSDYGKTNEALKSALSIADEYTTGVLYGTNYDTELKNSAIEAVYEHIVDRIMDASQFDNSWLNIMDDYNQEKVDTSEEIVKHIKDEKLFGTETDTIANNIQVYIDNWKAENTDENGNYTNPNLRNDLINNTARKALSIASNVYNTGSDLVGQVKKSDAFTQAQKINKKVQKYGQPGIGQLNIGVDLGMKLGQKIADRITNSKEG